MNATGVDGNLSASDSHITIQWKTLRGRLSSMDGASLEVIPISRIFEVDVIPATSTRKGCLQLHLIGNADALSTELNWMSNLQQGQISQGVMFVESAQFEFAAMAEHIRTRIQLLRRVAPFEEFGSGIASSG